MIIKRKCLSYFILSDRNSYYSKYIRLRAQKYINKQSCYWQVCKKFQQLQIIILYLAPMRITSSRQPQPNTLSQQPQAQQAQQPNQNNPDQQPQAQKKQRKKKQFALKPQNFQTGKGLKKLYQLTNQIKWQDSMPTQSAMNLVVITLKTWQRQMMPKYSYNYFFQRCQALGSNKLLAAYMHKVRRIHKGADQWDDTTQQNNNPNQQKPTPKPPKNTGDNDGIDLANPNIPNNQNYDDDALQLQKFKQRAQIAKQLANTTITPKPPKSNPNDPKTEKQLIDEMMDQDLRMFEEMSRRKNNNNGTKNNKVDDEYDEEGIQMEGVDLGGDSGVGFQDDGYYDD